MDFIKSLFSASYQRTITIVVLLLILAVLPLAVIVSQQQQDLRQRASGILSCSMSFNLHSITNDKTSLSLMEYIKIKITDATTGRILLAEKKVFSNEDPVESPSQVPEEGEVEFSMNENENPTATLIYKVHGRTDVTRERFQPVRQPACTGDIPTPTPLGNPTSTPPPAPSPTPILFEITEIRAEKQNGDNYETGKMIETKIGIKTLSDNISVNGSCTYEAYTQGGAAISQFNLTLRDPSSCQRVFTNGEVSEINVQANAPNNQALFFTNAKCQISACNLSDFIVERKPDDSLSFYVNKVTGPTQGPPANTPTPTRTPTPIPTQPPTAVPTEVALNCPANSPRIAIYKANGDANCDGIINILDFTWWRDEFTGVRTTRFSDFNNTGIVDIVDFTRWSQSMRDDTLPH